jgi:hypothetical protein
MLVESWNSLTPDQPMHAERAREQLRMDVARAGIITTDTQVTGYSYRKHNLTAQTNAHGLEIGRLLAGQRPNSDAILKSYFQGNAAVDIAAALVGEKRMERKVFDSLAMKQ